MRGQDQTNMETWTHMPAFLYATAPRERSPLPGRAHLGVEAILHKGKQGSGETKISPTNTRKSMRGYRNSIDKNKCEIKKADKSAGMDKLSESCQANGQPIS